LVDLALVARLGRIGTGHPAVQRALRELKGREEAGSELARTGPRLKLALAGLHARTGS
jgi:hypothetical protein